jgi:hypothetical protein
MSAFMVESVTVNSLAKMLMCKNFAYSVFAVPNSEAVRQLFPIGGNSGKNVFHTWEELADAMFLMNLKAMFHRYGREALLESTEEVLFDAEPDFLSTLQFFRSLDCYLYQCSGGNVQNSLLFKALSDMTEYVRHSLEYDEREYGAAVFG